MKTAYSLLICFILGIILVYAGDPERAQTGKASFYGRKFHNRKTASGKKYKRDDMVCAHRTYPFGTRLLVKNPKNDKEVVVEVIDRGPFRKKRIIDLSYAAAKEIGMINHGIIDVEVSEYFESDSLLLDYNPIEVQVSDTII